MGRARRPTPQGHTQPTDQPCPETVFLDSTLPAASTAAGASDFLLVTPPGLNVRPRPVEVLPTSSAVYREGVRAELSRCGLPSPVLEWSPTGGAEKRLNQGCGA